MSMRISESVVSEIALSSDIVKTISDYVNLKKAGKDYKGVCPFHGDKDPSFYVSPQKGIFHCFGCAVGGNVFNFIMRIENVPFVEAVKIVAEKNGITFAFEQGYHTSKDAKQNLLDVLESAHRFFKSNLINCTEVQSYLDERGITSEWISRLGFGYALPEWDGLVDHIRKSKCDINDGLAVGLIKARTTGGYYDAFRSRVIIPIYDLSDRCIGFGGRIIGDGEPKYLNSTESVIFHKKNQLFGLNSARESIKQKDFAIIVEGYFDQISLRIHGFENTVATLGTALTTDQIRLLKRFTSNIVLIFDGDSAGIRAVKRSIPLFLSESIEPKCLILKEDKDPDEAVRRVGSTTFQQWIDRSASAIDLFLTMIAENHDLNSVFGRNSALEECIPVLREIADSKERDYLIERFASTLRMRENRLQRLAFSANVKTPAKAIRKSLFDYPADERNVVRGMVLRVGFVKRVLESGTLKDIEDPVLSKLAKLIVDFNEDSDEFNTREFLNFIDDPDIASIIAGWLNPRPEEDDLRPEVEGDLALDQSLDRLRSKKLLRRKTEIQHKMKTCIPGGDEYNDLAGELWAIGQTLRK
jgi:DNA primase